MKAVVCYSGGHSSALTAIEAARRYGRENVILLNHDISPRVEHEDIKRFKREVAEYLGVPITYANADGFEEKTPLAIARVKNGFQPRPGMAYCTMYLKTHPFSNWLAWEYPTKDPCCGDITPCKEIVILYGFDANETERIHRRRELLKAMGYDSDFPLAYWERTIRDTAEIGIEKPSTYSVYKHANCIGCLKAGKQHWYCVFCLRPDIWEEAKEAESLIGHSIIKGVYLKELEPQFTEMRTVKQICPTDKGNSAAFWARVNKTIPEQVSLFPCECSI
jgi:hypothetical protein